MSFVSVFLLLGGAGGKFFPGGGAKTKPVGVRVVTHFTEGAAAFISDAL